jgi:hypothetical protein
LRKKKISEIVLAFGHENVCATHRSTLEFTKEKHLSRTGDCIVAIGANKAFPDFSEEFRENLRKPNAKLTITVEVDGIIEQINAWGSPKLVLTDPSDVVIRKSSHIDCRTLAVNADKSAKDLSRDLVEKLKIPGQNAKITLTTQS